MTLNELWHKVFPTHEQKQKIKLEIAGYDAKEYICISETPKGYPAVFINGTPVFYINDFPTNLEQRTININDVQPFVQSIRETYIEQHKHDDIRTR